MYCQLVHTEHFPTNHFVSLTRRGVALVPKLFGRQILIGCDELLGIAVLQSDTDGFARTKRNATSVGVGALAMGINPWLGVGVILAIGGSRVKQKTYYYVGVLLKDGRCMLLRADIKALERMQECYSIACNTPFATDIFYELAD